MYLFSVFFRDFHFATWEAPAIRHNRYQFLSLSHNVRPHSFVDAAAAVGAVRHGVRDNEVPGCRAVPRSGPEAG
jgi:hypothetical protein